MARFRTMSKALALCVAVLLLAVGTADSRPAATKAPTPAPAPASCSTGKKSSAVAVSIVFAECSGDVVLAAESIAQAATSGCGDAYAAGVGVSVANLAVTPGGLAEVLTSAFSSALTTSSTLGQAAAVSQGLAAALSSAAPSAINSSDILDDVAMSMGLIADSFSCKAGSKLAVTFYKTLLQTAPDLAPTFAADVSKSIGQCPKLARLSAYAASLGADPDDTKLAKLLKKPPGGRARGRCKLPLFSNDVERQLKSSSLAVTIANVSCPAAGDATVAAIAIATAAQTDCGAASSAIAGVLTSGVDVTSVFEQVAVMAPGSKRNAAIQAFAGALVASDAASQALLLRSIGAALNNIGAYGGCDLVTQVLTLFQGATTDGSANALPAVQPAQMVQLCAGLVCAGSCQTLGVSALPSPPPPMII